MEIAVNFPGGKRVEALFGDFTVATDQPQGAGGVGSAPAPFELFLASLATCAGFYALAYCQARNLTTRGLGLVQRTEEDPGHKLRRVVIELHVPADFPAEHVAGLQRAANACKVKKVLADPPAFDVSCVIDPPAPVLADVA